MKSSTTYGPVLICLTLLIANSVWALNTDVSPAEIAQGSDLIFAGTISETSSRFNESGTIILTDYIFTDVETIHATDRSRQGGNGVVVLTFAGGTVDDVTFSASGVPTLQNGHRYLVFTFDDGASYLCSVVGGPRGILEIVSDFGDERQYLQSLSGRRLVGVSVDHFDWATKTGHMFGQIAAPPIKEGETPLPLPAPLFRTGSSAPPISLASFLDSLHATLLTASTSVPDWRDQSEGALIRRENGARVRDPLPRETSSTPRVYRDRRNQTAIDGLPPVMTGGDLGACGYHNLPLYMEYPPVGIYGLPFWFVPMNSWNQFVEVFDPELNNSDDGSNGENEIIGYITNSELNAMYGLSWGSAIALCASWGNQCGLITESDIMFNAHEDWTQDFSESLGNDDLILVRPVYMHELAHAWGMQRGGDGWGFDETYDYDLPTVVHPYYHHLVENGNGIHLPDAYLLRADYEGQQNPETITDLGIESYWADEGLHNSTSDRTYYRPGDDIVVENVTVENMSTHGLDNVQVRFYLSDDREIDTSDHQLEGNYYYAEFPWNAYAVSTFNLRIPDDVAIGSYFVGAIVFLDGLEEEDSSNGYPENNATSLYAQIVVHCPAPSQPHNLSASDDLPLVIELQWSAVAGADGYVVRRDGAVIGESSDTVHGDYNCDPDVVYSYTVAARDQCGEGTQSAPAQGQCFDPNVAVDDVAIVPTVLTVLPNHPNPFNPATTVRYGVPVASRVRVGVYGIDGRLIALLADDQHAAGYHTRPWDGRDNRGNLVAAGTYFLRVEAGQEVSTTKMSLLK